jgi:hypothetical protein
MYLGDIMARMNKAQLNVSVSEEVKLKTEEYGTSDSYGSASNFVENAIMYYVGAIERERELKYEECKKELERLKKENTQQSSTILKLLNKHQELVDEVNEIEQQAHSVTSKILKLESTSPR